MRSAILASVIGLLLLLQVGCGGDPGTQAKAGLAQQGGTPKMDKATFGAGCFWGVEAAFRKVHGVVDTAVGYAGGTTSDPSYKDVCTDKTGHAEVVQVAYDPSIVSYARLLEVFWKCHDPTQVNRQGPDRGTQYRSVIFYHSEAQRVAADASKATLDQSRKWARPIATRIEPAPTFWRAEEYHQRYLEKRGKDNCHL